MIYPLVRELAATGAPVRVPVAVTCRVLKIAKQPFYRWLRDPVSDRDWDDAQLINAAVDAHEEAPTFGYRLIADELADLGFEASERRVWRICSENGIVSAIVKRRGKGKSGRQGPPVHDDLVKRVFTATAPNRLWLTDITEHWTGEGKLYCCAIKDVFSNRIVGYSIADRMTADLAVAALLLFVPIGHRPPLPSGCCDDQLSPVSSAPGASSSNSVAPDSPDRWEGSEPPATTQRWSRSSRCCRRMSSTSKPGPREPSCDSRSCTGSRPSTTDGDANGFWAV